MTLGDTFQGLTTLMQLCNTLEATVHCPSGSGMAQTQTPYTYNVGAPHVSLGDKGDHKRHNQQVLHPGRYSTAPGVQDGRWGVSKHQSGGRGTVVSLVSLHLVPVPA